MAESDDPTTGGASESTPTRTLVLERWSTALSQPASAQETIRRRASSVVTGSGSRTGGRRAVASRDEHAGSVPTEVDYRIEDLVAGGGMGLVYRARQASLDREVVLKSARDPDHGAEIAREAVLLGALEHPNIVPIYELGEREDGTLFYAMRQVSGEAWSQRIGRGSIDDDLEILDRVADAVAFAHSRGVIHCDLKPVNVLIGEHGQVVLVDWGVAMRVEEAASRPLAASEEVGGTPAYMAPELARADRAAIGVATDVYLLGAILFEVVSGRAPHHHDDVVEALVHAADNQLPDASGDVELLAIARACLTHEPERRYADVPAFQAALGEWRRHREARQLLAVADEHHQRALAEGRYRDYRRALHALNAAAAIWPQLPDRVTRELAVRCDFTRCALARGDLALAAEACRGDGPEFHELEREVAREGRRQVARRRQFLALRLGVPALLVIAMGVLLGFYVDWSQAYARADAAREQALAARDRAADRAAAAAASQALSERQRSISALRSAAALLAGEQPQAAREILAAIPVDERGWLWRRLQSLAGLDQWRLDLPPTRHLEVLAVHPRSTTLAVASGDGLRLFDLPGRREIGAVTLPEGHPVWLSYAADGEQLFVGSHHGVYRCDPGSATAEKLIADLPIHVDQGASDGRHLVLFGREPHSSQMQLLGCDLASGRLLSKRTFDEPRPNLHGLHVHDGHVVIMHYRDRVLRAPIADLADPVEELYRHNSHIPWVLWTADQRIAVVTYGNGSTGPIDLTGRRRGPWLRLPRIGRFARLSADGGRLVLVDLGSSAASVRGTFSDEPLRRFRADGTIHGLDLSADGRWLVLRSAEALQVFDLDEAPLDGVLASAPARQPLPGAAAPTLVWAPDGSVEVVDTATPVPPPVFAESVADGALVYRASARGIAVEHRDGGSIVRIGPERVIEAVAMVPDAGLLLGRGPEGLVWHVDAIRVGGGGDER